MQILLKSLHKIRLKGDHQTLALGFMQLVDTAQPGGAMTTSTKTNLSQHRKIFGSKFGHLGQQFQFFFTFSPGTNSGTKSISSITKLRTLCSTPEISDLFLFCAWKKNLEAQKWGHVRKTITVQLLLVNFAHTGLS